MQKEALTAPTRIAMAVGVGALLWALGYMQFIVVSERNEAYALLGERQNALSEYAMATYERFVRDDLTAALPRIEKAAKDQLADDEGLFLVEGGKLILPRVAEYKAGSHKPATTLYDALVSGEDIVIDEQDSPIARRISLLAELQKALDQNDRKNIETTFRNFLAEKLRFRISSLKDIPLTLAALKFLAEKSDPDRALMEKLLRDGLTTDRGGKIEGLQRQLINTRARFTHDDFFAMAKKIASLSERAGVESEDFLKVIESADSNRGWLNDAFELNIFDKQFPAIIEERWYAVKDKNRLAGISFSYDKYFARIAGEMRERHLMQEKDDLLLSMVGRASIYSHFSEKGSFTVGSERWTDIEKKTDRRFYIKTGLVIALALFSGIIIFLSYRYQERKEKYLKLQSNFIATVSHELRTPLASIRLLAETVQKKLAGRGVTDEYHPRIVKEIDGLTFLVENILSYNRLEKGGWRLHKSRVRLEEIVVWIRENTPLFTDRDTKITLAEGVDIEIDADPDLIKLLFLNLSRNACRYNKNDPVLIDIEAKKGERTVIQVSDNGVGIDENERTKVFSEFYRPEGGAITANQGSGLGLAICNRVMALHGGSIGISVSGKNGTTFELVF